MGEAGRLPLRDGRTAARRGAGIVPALMTGSLAMALAGPSPVRGAEGAGPPAQAAMAAPLPLSLQEAERRAEEVSPALRAADARVRMQEGRLRQSTLYPNPDLSLDALRFTSGFGIKETTLGLRQPIPYHGKRRLERDEAAALIEAARRDRDRARLDLLLEVREAFCRAFYTAQIVGAEQEDVETTRSLRQAIDARVAAGDAPPFESLKAAVELSRAESDLSLAQGEMTALLASFNLLLGWPADAPTAVGEPPRDLAPSDPLTVLQARAIENQPAIRAQEQIAQAAGLAARRARLERRPDLSIGPSVGAEEGIGFAGVGLSLKLPVWNRSQGNIAAAEAGRDEAIAQVDAARLAVSRLVAESYGRFRSAFTQRLLYEQGLLAEAAQLLETAKKSYEGGESGVLELLDARRTALAVKEGYHRVSLEAALAAIQLRRAVGEETAGSK